MEQQKNEYVKKNPQIGVDRWMEELMKQMNKWNE